MSQDPPSSPLTPQFSEAQFPAPPSTESPSSEPQVPETQSSAPQSSSPAAPPPDPNQDDRPAQPQEAPPAPLPRLTLRDGPTGVIDRSASYEAFCARVAAGTGPVALDAERASGYRYSQRAYLIQVRREGAGSGLVDPIAFDDLTLLDRAIGDAEWILHAATQDLPCLAEIGLRPARLFDTELAGRLLNLPRVGLASLVEHYLDRSLAKEYSAADWSTRPLPDPWLEYAALDVEVLIELRDLIEADLESSGKREWAEQEFTALLDFTGPPKRHEPWRRTSGIHKARGRRTLAIVRSLWEARDGIADDRDTTPGRILPDASMLEIARTAPRDAATLRQMGVMRNRGPRRFLEQWLDAVEQALALEEDELPRSSALRDGPPPPRTWSEKHPEAAARLDRSRAVIAGLCEKHDLPSENLLSPHLVRSLAWEPPAPSDLAAVLEVLTAGGARPWQIDLTAAPLTEALQT